MSRGILNPLGSTEHKRVKQSLPQETSRTYENKLQNDKEKDPKESYFVPIGTWPETNLEIDPSASVGRIIPEARTGTTLQNEEIEVGIDRAVHGHDGRSAEVLFSDSPHPAHHPQTKVPAPTKNSRLPEPHDYYRFEWFRILIALILLVTSQIIISILTLSGNVVTFVVPIVSMVAVGALATFCFVITFIGLQRCQTPMEALLQRYFGLRPTLLQSTLRVFAYIYPIGVIIALTFLYHETQGLKIYGRRYVTGAFNKIDYTDEQILPANVMMKAGLIKKDNTLFLQPVTDQKRPACPSNGPKIDPSVRKCRRSTPVPTTITAKVALVKIKLWIIRPSSAGRSTPVNMCTLLQLVNNNRLLRFVLRTYFTLLAINIVHTRTP